jgi:hypothetical protein
MARIQEPANSNLGNYLETFSFRLANEGDTPNPRKNYTTEWDKSWTLAYAIRFLQAYGTPPEFVTVAFALAYPNALTMRILSFRRFWANVTHHKGTDRRSGRPILRDFGCKIWIKYYCHKHEMLNVSLESLSLPL